jgi:hypothetical protein
MDEESRAVRWAVHKVFELPSVPGGQRGDVRRHRSIVRLVTNRCAPCASSNGSVSEGLGVLAMQHLAYRRGPPLGAAVSYFQGLEMGFAGRGRAGARFAECLRRD